MVITVSFLERITWHSCSCVMPVPLPDLRIICVRGEVIVAKESFAKLVCHLNPLCIKLQRFRCKARCLDGPCERRSINHQVVQSRLRSNEGCKLAPAHVMTVWIVISRVEPC